jgi:hypothetical protein
MRNRKTKRKGCFEYSFISKPSQICGTLSPFRPFWFIQHLGNGMFEMFDTKRECLGWIRQWGQISK